MYRSPYAHRPAREWDDIPKALKVVRYCNHSKGNYLEPEELLGVNLPPEQIRRIFLEGMSKNTIHAHQIELVFEDHGRNYAKITAQNGSGSSQDALAQLYKDIVKAKESTAFFVTDDKEIEHDLEAIVPSIIFNLIIDRADVGRASRKVMLAELFKYLVDNLGFYDLKVSELEYTDLTAEDVRQVNLPRKKIDKILDLNNDEIDVDAIFSGLRKANKATLAVE